MLGKFAVALGVLASSIFCQPAQAVDEVRTGFEALLIPPEFVPCDRPENAIAITGDRARSGARSLSLSINKTPLFPPTPPMASVGWLPSPRSCLLADQAALYRSDDAERAELWERKDLAPMFGEEAWYGFSMWVGRADLPYGDFNRVVLGQWKASYGAAAAIDYSPFLAQRFTGGFYHITLDVDARHASDDDGQPKTCRMLLAFMAGPPSALEPELDLGRPAACEWRLRPSGFDLIPAAPIEVERAAYLPNPFDRWTDLVFRIKGGEDGIVQVWANGTLIASARGWIGHRAAAGTRQYFKFGPYRDPAPNPLTVYLDNLARGNSKAYVDPAQD